MASDEVQRKQTTAGQATAPPDLLPHHWKDLQTSGISLETIEAAGIFSETNHTKIASILNRRRWSRKNGPALVFPYRDSTGTAVQFRVKPDYPPQHNGKPAKYLSPSGSTARVFIPPKAFKHLDDAQQELIITEGGGNP